MQPLLRACLAVGCLLFVPGVQAQSANGASNAREDFALAVAKAHAETSLAVMGAQPFEIWATIDSNLALRGTGKGTYQNRWIDSQHWSRVIAFSDFEQSEMRNDSGHSWVEQSSEDMPLRVQEMLTIVTLHLPSAAAASSVPVTESAMVGDHGEALACYSVTAPTPADGFARSYRYCFDKATGVLVSEDAPLNTHVVYSNFITFEGKREFTHVRVASGNFPVLELSMQYRSLGAHALDGVAPDSSMHRSKSAESSPNPEEVRRGSVEYRFNPPLPPGTPDADKTQPVKLRFRVSADNKLLDACVEDAPTLAMAEAALEAARKFTFTPLSVGGRPAGNLFYAAVWFQADGNAGLAVDAAKKNASDAPLAGSAPGVYRNDELSFAFRYPAGFVPLPRGQLEEQLHVSGAHHYGLDPGGTCNTLLFRAQRLRSGSRTPDVLSIMDLDPSCIFGAMDRRALAGTIESAAKSFIHQIGDGHTSEPREYQVNGQIFAVVSATATRQDAAGGELNMQFVATTIRHHVLCWEAQGSDAGSLTKTLRESTLQIDEEREVPLFPFADTP